MVSEVRPQDINPLSDFNAREFVLRWQAVARHVHDTAVAKGWWENPRNTGEIIALCHSELSECLEAIRRGNPKDEHCPEFSGVEIELADCIIRIMDFAHAFKHRVPEALLAKLAFNETRPYRHGGKAA